MNNIFDDIEIPTSSNQGEKVVKDEVTNNHINSDIIAKKEDNIKILEVDEILKKMVHNIPNNVKLIEVLTKELKDPLYKYRDEDSNINLTKIPDNLYIVAIVNKLLSISELQGWDIARENDFIYLYNGRYWTQCIKDDLYKFFRSIAKKMNFYSPAKAETHKFKDDLYKQFMASSKFYKTYKNKDIVLLNCLNGTLEVTQSNIKLREHKQDDFIKYVLPFEYDKTAKAPIFERYLNDVLDKDSQKVLQEYAGYIFINNLKLETALVLYGSGANGKSVFFEVLTALLGDVNISTMSLGDLTDKNSGESNRAMLKDKLVNYGSEIRGQNIDIDIFKRLVSGEPVQARLKYGNPFMLESNTKMIFNANELPNTNEHSEAVFRRFIIVPFNITIPKPKRDPELHNKIINNELSGVLNWVLVGLERLLKNKVFSESKKVNEAIEQYKKESDTVSLFIEEHNYTTTDQENYLKSSKKLYEEYQTLTKDNGQYPLSKNKFGRRLKALGFKDHNTGAYRGYLVKKVSF
jgi:putative DNA primase/helicase